MYCGICGRPLSQTQSVVRGIGPVCWANIRAREAARADHEDAVLLDLIGNGSIVLRRRQPNVSGIATNIPQLHKHHSPSGYEWGYYGSGPSDLALNIAARVAPLQPALGRVKLWDGTEVSDLAMAMHQPLKEKFIGPLDRDAEEIVIAGSLIDDWARGFLWGWAQLNYLVPPDIRLMRLSRLPEPEYGELPDLLPLPVVTEALGPGVYRHTVS